MSTEVTDPKNSSQQSGQWDYTNMLPPKGNDIAANAYLCSRATSSQQLVMTSVEGATG